MLDDYSNASVGMDEGLRSESLGPESMAQNHWLLKRWESRAVSGLNLPKLLIVTQFLSAGSSCLVSLVCLLQSSPYIPLMWAKIPHSLLNSQFLMTSPPPQIQVGNVTCFDFHANFGIMDFLMIVGFTPMTSLSLSHPNLMAWNSSNP